MPAGVAAVALIRGGMVEGAGDALYIGFVGYARRAPIGTLALALGPVLVCALPALLWVLPFRLTREPRVRLLPAVTAFAVGVLLFYFASLPHRDPIWVGWRAGQIMLVALPRARRHLAGVGPVSAGVAVWRRSPSRSPRWSACRPRSSTPTTRRTSRTATWARGFGCRWPSRRPSRTRCCGCASRRATTAVVQVDVAARGADTWTLIPTFAQRRMYAGLPISLLAEPEYRNRAAAVAAAFETLDVDEAHRIFRAGHVDYVYVGDAERRAHRAEALAKFDQRPDAFARVFENAAATIYEVR